MAVINHQTRTITYRFIYAGANGSGKSDNLMALSQLAYPESDANKCIRIPIPKTQSRKYYIALPLGEDGEFSVRVQLCTLVAGAEGQHDRTHSLPDADGLVFVIDPAQDPNVAIDAWNELVADLEGADIDPAKIPILIQFNQRTSESVGQSRKLSRLLNRFDLPEIDAATGTGMGVNSTVKEIYLMCHLLFHRRFGGAPRISQRQDCERIPLYARRSHVAEPAETLLVTDVTAAELAAVRAEGRSQRSVPSDHQGIKRVAQGSVSIMSGQEILIALLVTVLLTLIILGVCAA